MNPLVNATLSRRAMLRAAGAGLPALAGLTRDTKSAPSKVYWPRANEWETRSPKDAGMDPAGVEDALNYAAERNSSGLIILAADFLLKQEHYRHAGRHGH
jgi:hypothetical protein